MEAHDTEPVAVLLADEVLGVVGGLPDLLEVAGLAHGPGELGQQGGGALGPLGVVTVGALGRDAVDRGADGGCADRGGDQDVLRIGRRIGDKLAVAFALKGLACLASDAAAWQQAAVLHGAAQALLDATGVAAWPPMHARYRQESLDQIATALGDEQHKLAQTHGMALSVDQAIDLALAQPPASDIPSIG